MDEEMTQATFDKCCRLLKESFDEAVRCSGYDSIAMAISCGENKKDIMNMMAFYEFEVIPSAKRDGLAFKTASELFGVEVKITEVPADE
ncbi:hypothetical protein [Vibrio parahaemolyticus]|uniref:hypothetical protein n=1 Tax=Vibrio parahaemolyticus TaxID=670 RepID=UPI000C86BD2A|nr:hypothetical protein [Vibrio parahaemolyticus]PMS49932.1 hypothetical protein C1S89_09045 [Vibrio parahaemolyticus]PMS55003.1 hypothetical protein C1T11_00220 [Vibrio parahaemolyticus]PMS60332.1 hypothetical protein C1T09_00270 [Vibrio parahaemolyticus]PMS90420.1 hypothetical protein C1S90_00270 [Vibrio parahaemolyticus]PMS94176.1 hypothetical protein C1T06_10450 [Vibrio parahaemolyticus]